MTTHVRGFFGEWRPFSNFHTSPVVWGDEITSERVWSCVETPYQLAKTLDPAERAAGIELYKSAIGRPGTMRKWGQTCTMQPNWRNTVDGGLSLGVMRRLVEDKFLRDDSLSELLLSTGDDIWKKQTRGVMCSSEYTTTWVRITWVRF